MRTHIDGIDHVVILVRDLDRAADTYARLGFTLTPRGFHSLGSQNHCVMFGNDYFELLAVPRPHPVMAYFSEFLSRAEGLAAITTLRHLDATRVVAALAAQLDAAEPEVRRTALFALSRSDEQEAGIVQVALERPHRGPRFPAFASRS